MNAEMKKIDSRVKIALALILLAIFTAVVIGTIAYLTTQAF